MNAPIEESDIPAFRYSAGLARSLETKWQQYWAEHKTFETPNPAGNLANGFDKNKKKLYVLDMFPYPSGSGLHVGHTEGFTGTDTYVRFKRMDNYNVLYTMGFDAFGLPAEQYAVQTGTHPRVTTENNISNMVSQLRRLGYSHDERRRLSSTDVEYYRWTQWMFLQIFNSWFDEEQQKARPIDELVKEFETGQRQVPSLDGVEATANWSDLNSQQQQEIISQYRLAYRADVPVNWCPGLGTVLANEEVTVDGRSDRGNFPVYKRKLPQWMMRITAYADRLVEDLDLLDWTESIKTMQRNWIGRSSGAEVRFGVVDKPSTITVYTTRPDTLFGCSYMVLAPEIDLVDELLADAWPANTNPKWTGGAATPKEAIDSYRAQAERRTEAERTNLDREKTGVFTGTYAINPINNQEVPVFIADYVLGGYGTGAIMAVPCGDERDFEFATKFELPIPKIVTPPQSWIDEHSIEGKSASANDTTADAVEGWTSAYTGHDAKAINSANANVDINGLDYESAKAKVIEWLESSGHGRGTKNTKMRDWLFSRQRYWGEPLPIVYDESDKPIALPESMLPLTLPEVSDYAPQVVGDEDVPPAPPLSRATEWANVTLDLGDGPKSYRRDLNTMPQWAGSCWYELRYLDPTNTDRFVDPEVEKYWSNDKSLVDLYVGGVEHAVLHLLYARFWHKVLYDLGHLQTIEPFGKLFNQGMIQGYVYTDSRGMYVAAAEVEERDGEYFYNGERVTREIGKLGKSLKNAIDPVDVMNEYSADTLRLYILAMGPLDKSKPWDSKNIVGVHRFLQRLWRNVLDEQTGLSQVAEDAPNHETLVKMHQTIAGVRHDYETFGFNTAISKLIEFNNHLTTLNSVPRLAAETAVLLLAPLAPHACEELWSKLGHNESLHYEPFPVADETLLVQDSVEVPVQINGKVRAKINIAAKAEQQEMIDAAMANERIIELLEGKEPKKVVAVSGRLVSIVV